MALPRANSYRDLIVWQKAMMLVEMAYELGRALPREEVYGLRSQLTRAAVSVPANIAEGFGRTTSPDYARFLDQAMGSAFEVDTLLEIALRLGYSTDLAARCIDLNQEVCRMISALRSKVRQSTVREIESPYDNEDPGWVN